MCQYKIIDPSLFYEKKYLFTENIQLLCNAISIKSITFVHWRLVNWREIWKANGSACIILCITLKLLITCFCNLTAVNKMKHTNNVSKKQGLSTYQFYFLWHLACCIICALNSVFQSPNSGKHEKHEFL